MKDRRLLKRYLISYLLVLSLPLVLLGVVVQRYFLQSHSQSILREKVLQLNQVQAALEAQIKPLRNFSTLIALDNRFALYTIENNPTAYIDILQELRYLMHINSSLYEVLYHPLGSDLYYQSRGTATARFLFSSIMRYEELDSDTCEAFFAQLHTPAWLKTQTAYGGELIYTYVHPLPMNQSVALFQIQARALDALFPDPETIYLLSDAAGRVFHAPHNRLEAFDGLSLPGASVMTDLTWAGVPYCAYRTPVGEGHFSITALIPRAQIARATQEFARTYYVVLTGVILLGAAAVYWMLRMNYQPIRRLGTAARALDRSVPENLDSLESVYHALHNLASHPPLRDADLQAMRQARLFCLLRGQYESIEAFNADCERLNLYLSGGRFRVAILSGAYESEGAMPGPALFEQLHRMLLVEFEAFLLEYVEQFSYILILSEEPGQEDRLPQRLEMLQAHYRETTQRALLIGIGEAYDSPGDILRSYGEAKAALQYGLARTASLLYWYRDLEQAQLPACYPNEELQALHAALVNGQAAKVEFIVQLLIDMVRNQFKSLFLSVCLCYDVVNVILRTLQEIHCTSAALEEYADLRERRALGSVEELTETVGRLCREAVALLEAEQARDEGTLDMRAVLEYIDRHKADPDFCVGSLANRFDLSISNFSHQFKDHLGVNVSTYINDLRLAEAQLLLRSTDLPIGEIALKIGYLQPSSFIRKFRQTIGQTPGEYRQRNRSLDLPS